MPAKILNENELDLFLKVLAEESVKKAYQQELSSALPLFEQDEEEEDPLFGGDEKEEAGDEGKPAGDEEDPLADIGAEEEEEPAEEPAEEPPAKQPEEKVEVRPTPLTLELGEVTSDGLIATLNMVRAGRSFKEPDVAAQIKKYFEDQLNDAERLALATFLSALRDLTSGTPAEDAPEPGDENVNIDATGKERQEEEPDVRAPSRPALQPTVQAPARGSLEDTTPPIQVGPRNARLAEEYREHIRSFLLG